MVDADEIIPEALAARLREHAAAAAGDVAGFWIPRMNYCSFSADHFHTPAGFPISSFGSFGEAQDPTRSGFTARQRSKVEPSSSHSKRGFGCSTCGRMRASAIS